MKVESVTKVSIFTYRYVYSCCFPSVRVRCCLTMKVESVSKVSIFTYRIATNFCGPKILRIVIKTKNFILKNLIILARGHSCLRVKLIETD